MIFLLLNTLFMFVKAFLPRSKLLLISWLQSPYTVILEDMMKNLSLFPPRLLLFALKNGAGSYDQSFLIFNFKLAECVQMLISNI